MNVYDFDKTIYPRDSTVQFYCEMIVRHPALLLSLPGQAVVGVRYLAGKISKTNAKAAFFSAFARIPDMEKEVKAFWDRHEADIEPYYLAQRKEDDVVISASPEFLLAEIIRRLGIGGLLASRVDPKTGAYTGENCYGAEKVSRFRAAYPNAEVHAFYSDSLSDAPMADVAEKAYLIRRHRPTEWPTFPEK